MKHAPQLLLVDDDPEYCQTLSHYLQEQGFVVSFVPKAHQGWLDAIRGKYDLVILADNELAGSSGFEVLRKIRRQKDVPVVVLSAQMSEIDAIVMLELGADDYLLKSCNRRELVARLRRILHRTR
ncbi:MAG: response regulator [Rhodocyclales bacterium]|nr:response regulator [Rhodocyclales bacterium]